MLFIKGSKMSTFEEFAYSWVTNILKQVVGTGEMRNRILKYYLRNHNKNIIYGPTFSVGETEKQLFAFFKKITSVIKKGDNKIILFTINNSFGNKDKILQETHYQTFIVDTRKKVIIMIDPSRKSNKIGIYSPYASMLVYFYFHKYCRECKIFWLNLKYPLQLSFTKKEDMDVFCQSWSLYLQKEAILENVIDNPSTIIDIPKKLDEKYSLLANFYRDIIKIPSVKKYAQQRWKHLDSNDEVILEINKRSDPENFIYDIMDAKLENIVSLVESIESSDLYNKKAKVRSLGKNDLKYSNEVSKEEIKEFDEIVEEYSLRNSPEVLSSSSRKSSSRKSSSRKSSSRKSPR